MNELPRLAKTILLVDDEPYNLEWLVEFLEAKTYQVEVARRVDLALERLQENRFRAVIVDLNIPLGDAQTPRGVNNPAYASFPGLTVAEYARGRGHLDRQVILYSVHDDPGVRAEASRLRCSYIRKGRPRHVKAELEDVLGYDPLDQES